MLRIAIEALKWACFYLFTVRLMIVVLFTCRSVSSHVYTLFQSLSDVICIEVAYSFSHTRKAILLQFSKLLQNIQYHI